jgi:hypothetical protein
MGANQDRACPELLPIVCYYGKLSKRDKKVPPHLPVYSIFCYCQVGIAATRSRALFDRQKDDGWFGFVGSFDRFGRRRQRVWGKRLLTLITLGLSTLALYQ